MITFNENKRHERWFYVAVIIVIVYLTIKTFIDGFPG